MKSEVFKPELWVTFPNREDYMISNTGKVKSYHAQWKKWVDKKLRVDSKGYLTVGISPKGSKATNSTRVHRLVASAFIPNPSGLPYVNHKDNNPKNNDASNLEWCDAQYNMDYSWHSGERVSGQALPVALYVDGIFFSNYSSVHHCCREFSTNKKFFELSKGRTIQLDGLFRIERVEELSDNENLNRQVLKKRLPRLSSKPLTHGGVPYSSVKEFSQVMGITYRQGEWICNNKKEYNGLPIEFISMADYVRTSDLILW